MKHERWLATVLLAVLPWTAWAHTNDWMAKKAGPHGGKLRSAGDYHIELVVSQDMIHVHVTDHRGKPLNTRSGVCHVEYGTPDGRHKLSLQPTGQNSFMGSPDKPVNATAPLRVKVHLHGDSPEEAEFDQDIPVEFKKERK